MRTFINTVGIVILILVLLTFSLNNNTPVEISYYWGRVISFPLWGVILIPFFAGVITGNLLDVIQRFKLKNEIKKLKREFKTMNQGH